VTIVGADESIVLEQGEIVERAPIPMLAGKGLREHVDRQRRPRRPARSSPAGEEDIAPNRNPRGGRRHYSRGSLADRSTADAAE